MMKNLVIAITAHVDAGKTTLCEALLYKCGRIRKIGRVDNKDSFFDSSHLEKSRGITINAHSASFEYGDSHISLLDTPGHADFYSETERVLKVSDYAVLIISGTDSIQSQTVSIWKTLSLLNVPVIVFISKMDISYNSRSDIISALSSGLGGSFLDFTDGLPDEEDLALSCDAIMDEFMSSGHISACEISASIKRRDIFPCVFGSGLKSTGIDALLELIDDYCIQPEPETGLSGRVFKITHDSKLGKLSWLRLYGGNLSVRSQVIYNNRSSKELPAKINGIYMLAGAKYEPVTSCHAGQVCAVAGFSDSQPGSGIGSQPFIETDTSTACMSYSVEISPDTDLRYAASRFAEISDEEPSFNIRRGDNPYTYSINLLGEIQRETFIENLKEKYDINAKTSSGKILYRETIKNTVEGIGHFEPLRHYAEVHILIEPLPRGTGIEYRSICPEDSLDRNWQRLILTNLSEKQHLGVLTGSPLTDVRYTLVSGKAHIKHTEGGDFREAVYRAIRMGLMSADSVLLEPFYEFTFEFPPAYLSRIINDIKNMNGSCESKALKADTALLKGSAPVSCINGYLSDLRSFTRGKCIVSLIPSGYRECKNSAAVISGISYNPDRDTDNPSDSVFCSHGSGMSVKWNEVSRHMHLPGYLTESSGNSSAAHSSFNRSIDESELEEIMLREFGPVKRPVYSRKNINIPEKPAELKEPMQEYVIIDGYNLLYALPEYKKYVNDNPDLARSLLLRRLIDYTSFSDKRAVVVYDAYRDYNLQDKKHTEENVSIVFTARGETADEYIQKLLQEIGKNYNIRVVTDDSLIRLSALGSGVLRLSTVAFQQEMNETSLRIAEYVEKKL